MVWDFKQFPELPNSEMAAYYWESPHKQVTENFKAKVVKVHDGDTITLEWEERIFTFPLRLLDIDAPELSVKGGIEAREKLREFCEGALVEIIIDENNRVEKYGRLLGDVLSRGILASEFMIATDNAVPFDQRREDLIPSFENELKNVHVIPTIDEAFSNG